MRIFQFAILYLAGASAAIGLGSRVDAGWQWIALLPLYLLAAASLHGISLFTHEAVHGTASARRGWNHVVGALCAWPVLQNYSAYRVLHLEHHQHLGKEGDPDHYGNYTRWSWLLFGMNWLRLLVGYPVYIVAIPLLGLRKAHTWGRMAILLEVLVVLMLAWGALQVIPMTWLWHGWVLPMIAINFMVNIRGMSQHTLLESATNEIEGTRSILTSRMIRYFMCNENYHLEHHLYPGVPWHQLPLLHCALREPLERQGAPYIPSYSAFVRDFVRSSWQRSPGGRCLRKLPEN